VKDVSYQTSDTAEKESGVFSQPKKRKKRLSKVDEELKKTKNSIRDVVSEHHKLNKSNATTPMKEGKQTKKRKQDKKDTSSQMHKKKSKNDNQS